MDSETSASVRARTRPNVSTRALRASIASPHARERALATERLQLILDVADTPAVRITPLRREGERMGRSESVLIISEVKRRASRRQLHRLVRCFAWQHLSRLLIGQ